MALENLMTKWFRFTTDHGEVYAVAVLEREEGQKMLPWKVGFAFCSPQDRCMPRGTRAKTGYNIAGSRARNGHEGMSFVDPTKKSGIDDLREAISDLIVKRVLSAARLNHPQIYLGLRHYNGKGEGDFRTWLKGKFLEQFRERYL